MVLSKRAEIVGRTWAETHPGALGLVLLAAVVVVGVGVKLAAPVLVPLVLGALVATVSAPLVAALRAHKIPRGAAIGLAILADAAALAAFGALVAGSVGELSLRLPEYARLLADAAEHLTRALRRWSPTLVSSDLVNPAALVGFAATLIGGVAGVLWNVLLAVIIASFVLVEMTGRRPPATGAHPYAERMRGAIREVNKYVAIKTAVSAATGLLIGTWIWLWDGDLPVLFGLLAFLLNYIPNVGSILAAVPAIGLTLLQHGAGPALVIALGYLLVNTIIGNIVEPRVMGRALGLSPLVVLLSVVVWGWLLGPVGALLSALLTVFVKLALSSTEDLRALALLLGPASLRPGAPASAEQDLVDVVVPQTSGRPDAISAEESKPSDPEPKP